ncbi:tubulin-folding cofactor B [Podarcis lilfordi]|nr:tubulin-folding cofactor B [Podarcis lilfordi]
MDLELYTPDDKFVMKLDSDEALLGSYPIDDGCRIHVIDRSGATIGEYENVSKVEKFEITDAEYDKRTDTARSFMKTSKLGQYNAEEMMKREAEREQKLLEEKALAEAISVGSRCEVRAAGQPNKRGTVMYVGEYLGACPYVLPCRRESLCKDWIWGGHLKYGAETSVRSSLKSYLVLLYNPGEEFCNAFGTTGEMS